MSRRRVFQTISALALCATIGAPFAYLAGALALSSTKAVMLLATLGWFVHAPLWMGRGDDGGAKTP